VLAVRFTQHLFHLALPHLHAAHTMLSPTPRMKSTPPNSSSAQGMRIGIVVSQYHAEITHAMRDAARQCFLDAGGRDEDLTIIDAPGSFELIALATALADQQEIDAVVTLGCIITGETTHDQYIAHAVANGLAALTVSTGVPVAFGVLTCQTLAQARERAGGKVGNKGEEAMQAAIASFGAVKAIYGIQEVTL